MKEQDQRFSCHTLGCSVLEEGEGGKGGGGGGGEEGEEEKQRDGGGVERQERGMGKVDFRRGGKEGEDNSHTYSDLSTAQSVSSPDSQGLLGNTGVNKGSNSLYLLQ